MNSIKIRDHNTNIQMSSITSESMNIFDLKTSFAPLICDDFPIQIRSLTGNETRVTVHHKMLVSELKELIEKQDQTAFDQQRLVYNGKQLEDERTLDYYNIIQDTVVHIILRIRGGMFHETSSRKDFDSVQWVTLESIEDLEEKIRLLKMNL